MIYIMLSSASSMTVNDMIATPEASLRISLRISSAYHFLDLQHILVTSGATEYGFTQQAVGVEPRGILAFN